MVLKTGTPGAENSVAALLLCLGAALAPMQAAHAAPRQAEAAAPEAREDDRLNAFLDEVFEREVAESPIRQSRLGRKTDRSDEWDDFSDAFADREAAQTKEDLAALRERFDRAALSEDGRISYDLFELNAEADIAAHRFRRNFYVVDQFNGQVSGLLTVLQNNHPIETVADAEDYVARVAGLKAVLETLAAQLRDRADYGVVTPAFAFPDMIADARSMGGGAPITAGGRENPLYADFTEKVSRLDIPDAEREALTDKLAAALKGPYAEGFSALIAELERLRPIAEANGNKGVWSLPDGGAYYQNRIREETTLDLTADEIHEIGLADIARIHDEMRAIMAEVGFEGDLEAFFAFIKNDPDNYYENSDAGREAFLAEARGLVAAIYEDVGTYFNRVPKADLEVRRVEPWRENSTSIAFYNRPSEDGSRPGIYYANLADMESVQKYVFTAITYHESAPGHHFQIALAQELPGLPKFRRFGGYGAFTEGWALYAEQLAREMGFYADPYRNFGRLQNELWRSVRLVVDTGIHAKRWTREECIAFFQENTPLSDGDIVTEVERFFVNPGQALSYKMGMMKILELRRRARTRLGEDFDIRDFHDAVIGAGSLPLPVLERRVEGYIEAAAR